MQRYDRFSIALHWLTAGLVVVLWTLGQTIDWFPRGLPRVAARSTHITFGLTLFLVLACRLAWRTTRGARLPPADCGWLRVVSTGTHGTLYVLLCSTVLLGIANAWLRGDTLFGLISFPAFDPANKPLRTTVENLHGLSADALVVVAGLHAMAGLIHHFIWKDQVLQRMMPLVAPLERK